MNIPFVQLHTPEAAAMGDSILNEIRGVFESSQFILGEPVSRFEERFAQVAGCRFAVGVNSGLDALLLSLRVAGIGPGDEVITAPNSFIASAAAIALVGARPVFADVGDDFNLDPKCVEAAITPRTKAIMPVHLTGKPCVLPRHGHLVIEDAAQAIGASYGGKAAGCLGDFGCFSLHPLKNLHVWGDGGMITVNDAAIAEKLKRARNHGLVSRDESEAFSYNSRLDTVQAVVGLASLELLPEVTRRRRENAAIYRERLSGIVTCPEDSAGAVYHVFQIRTRERHQLRAHLAERGIETKVHYPIPIHLQPAAAYLGYRRGDFPVAERLAGEILSLPVRENLTREEIEYICDAIMESPFAGVP